TAIWDGWELVELTPGGEVLDRIGLPVPRPSGLRFSRDGRRLIVTSASVRLSPSQLLRAPLSGSVLVCEL
ncbi:MAG TPA: SMP-30/gluconolactonase/LRE family protein, partial [Sphingomonas sp.]|nr:SMP-30/gluconolactonase/LRE family protein [Sphingomonas sp.]